MTSPSRSAIRSCSAWSGSPAASSCGRRACQPGPVTRATPSVSQAQPTQVACHCVSQETAIVWRRRRWWWWWWVGAHLPRCQLHLQLLSSLRALQSPESERKRHTHTRRARERESARARSAKHVILCDGCSSCLAWCHPTTTHRPESRALLSGQPLGPCSASAAPSLPGSCPRAPSFP
jgi:hypothetical protein